MASKDIVTQDGSLTPSAVLAWFDKPFTIEAIQENPDEVAKRIRERMYTAETPADLFGEAVVLHGKDYLNKPFYLTGLELRPSDREQFKDGLPFYGIFEIVDKEGERQVMTCGAASVVEKACIAAEKGWIGKGNGLWLKLVKSEKPTANNQYPLDLISAGVEGKPGEAF